MSTQPAKSAVFRLSATIAATILATSLIAMLAIYAVTAQHLEKSLRVLVETDLRGYSELYDQRRIIAVRQAFERRAKTVNPTNEVFLLLDKQGKKLAGNIDHWPEKISKVDNWQKFSIASTHSGAGRYFGSTSLLPGGFAILVARSLRPKDAILSQLRWAIGLSALVIAVVSVLLGWFLSKRILGRISAVNSVCLAVENGDLSARVADKSPDEFGRLASHVNTMLERISSLMRGTREVSDRIAHELRTPLNRILLRVENLREGPLPLRVQGELATVSNDLNETIEVFEALLDIAETEVGVHDNTGFEPVDLAATVNDILSLYQVVADEKKIVVSTNIDSPAFILGDKNLLARAIANLLDNALKFSPTGGQVSVSLTLGDQFHYVKIMDNGPGLDQGMQGRAFERFSRGRNVAATPGHGLGLAIVQANCHSPWN